MWRGDPVDAIVVALITGGLSLIGVIITNLAGQRQTEQKLATAQAVIPRLRS